MVAGCLLLWPGLGLLFGGGALAYAYAFDRNDAGYFEVTLNGVQSPTAAITSELPTLTTDVASPAWLMDALGGTIRMRVTPTVTGQPIFVGSDRRQMSMPTWRASPTTRSPPLRATAPRWNAGAPVSSPQNHRPSNTSG